MIFAEIVNTCSHEKIAAAAVASLGADFRNRIERAAENDGLSAGAFAVACVQRFAAQADPARLVALQQATIRHDMPVLAGLRHILEAEEGRARPFDRSQRTSVYGPWWDGHRHVARAAEIRAG